MDCESCDSQPIRLHSINFKGLMSLLSKSPRLPTWLQPTLDISSPKIHAIPCSCFYCRSIIPFGDILVQRSSAQAELPTCKFPLLRTHQRRRWTKVKKRRRRHSWTRRWKGRHHHLRWHDFRFSDCLRQQCLRMVCVKLRENARELWRKVCRKLEVRSYSSRRFTAWKCPFGKSNIRQNT